eukprot:6693094-Prymnesium_polylepis.1
MRPVQLLLLQAQLGASLVQWASTASASSEYSTSGNYAATMATGPADLAPSCADDGRAWSPLSSGSAPEWLL